MSLASYPMQPFTGLLSAYQGSINGLVFGPGTDVRLISLEGFRALPQVRSGDVSKPRADGSFAGLNFLDERTITATFGVFAPDRPFETVLSEVTAALQNVSDPSDLFPFAFMAPGWLEPRQAWVRPMAASIVIDKSYQFQDLEAIAVQLSAPDPLIYSASQHTAGPLTVAEMTVGGLTFPTTFPITLDPPGGQLFGANLGTVASHPVITVTGGMDHPIIYRVDSGQRLDFGISLATTDVLVIDVLNRAAILNGTTSVLNTLATGSQWFDLPPGGWAVGCTPGNLTTPSGSFQVQWFDAWGIA